MIALFVLRTKGDVKYFTIHSFDKSNLVKHCFTTRCGGVSQGEWESMNLRINCGDKRENILKNYEIISETIGVNVKSLVLSKQIHKTDIVDVDKNDCGNGLFYDNKFDSADALVTNQKGVTLVTFYADCVPVFLLDTKREVLALIHSGWRGTYDEITPKTIKHMIDKYNSNPNDIIAAIGPCIRQCHFQVGEDIAKLFAQKYTKKIVIQSSGKIYIDLPGCINMQLTSMGILPDNITDAMLCTYCNPELFYSHRRDSDKRGTMAAIAALV